MQTSCSPCSDFRNYFKSNPKGVYSGPAAGAVPEQAHAVMCYGYSNTGRFWLCRNSWGPGFADGGSFRVAYGKAGVMAPGETFGILWTPKAEFKGEFRVKLMTSGAQTGGCYIYQARPGDCASSIAEALWGPGEAGLVRLLRDNAGVIKDLDVPLTGKQLKVCGVKAGNAATTGHHGSVDDAVAWVEASLSPPLPFLHLLNHLRITAHSLQMQ